MRPRNRIVPPEYIELGHNLIEARDHYEDLLGDYREMTMKLAETVYLSALANVSPFSYRTLRNWIIADAELGKVPTPEEEIA